MSKKKMQHEIILEKVAKVLTAAGYMVSVQREQHQNEEDTTPHSFSYELSLEIKLGDPKSPAWVFEKKEFDKLTISAHYECLDTNDWIYSDTEICELYIVSFKQVWNSTSIDAMAEARRIHSEIAREGHTLIAELKKIHPIVKLHASYDSVNPAGQHSAASCVAPL